MTREELGRIKSITARVENVRLMHETMVSMNDETAYFSWIYTMPDEPSEEDFEDFASDKEEYEHLVDVFFRLFDAYRKDGLYEPSEEVEKFVADFGDVEILRRYK